MTHIQVAHHLYTNVESDQSPRGLGGFQTLFHTRSSLTEGDVRDIEARSVYFPSESNPVKHTFYATSSGKIVIAQVVSLAEKDRIGRAGRYLAHSLVLTTDSFSLIGAHPFHVFRASPFITSVEEALEKGDPSTGDMPLTDFELPLQEESTPDVAAAWSTEELKKLTLLGLRVDDLQKDRLAVTFVGNSAEALAALEAAFLAIPTPVRPCCSFDTHFYRCNLVATYFWAVGLTECEAHRAFVVDSQCKTVSFPMSLQAGTCYERWAMERIDQGEFALLAQSKDEGFNLCELIDNRLTGESEAVVPSAEIVTSVLKVNHPQVLERLRLQLLIFLPLSLTDRLFDRVCGSLTNERILFHLQRGFEVRLLLDALFEDYASQPLRTPPRGEQRDLTAFLRQHEHPRLGALLAFWSRHAKALSQAVARLSDDEYRHFLRQFLGLGKVKPITCLDPSRLDIFLDVYVEPQQDFRRDWCGLVQKMLKAEAGASLNLLTRSLSHWTNKELRQVQRLVSRREEVPEAFKKALDSALGGVPR